MPGPIKIVLRRKPKSDEGFVELKSPNGESSDTDWFDLPWHNSVEWQAVFQSLELYIEDPETWPTKPDVLEKAQELGLFLKGRPSNDRFKIIGQTLYQTVFSSKEIERFLYGLLRAHDDPVLEFHIQDEGSRLQAYPWELLCDSEGFLFKGKRAFPVRHVNFEDRITQFDLTEALGVLYVAPRPEVSSHNLPVRERLHLESLNRYYPGHLALESLSANTLDNLQKHLIRLKKPVHIVHIDTHGRFNEQGYVAFETIDGKVDWISGDDLGERLHKRGVQAVILSACRSGLVGGKSTFNSVAGALVKQCIPAVVAMQFIIEVNQADKFAEIFYLALVNGKPLTEAVAEARIALSEDSWYRPVLYLRTDSSNYQGKIFEPKLLLNLPKKLTPREKWITQLGFKRDPFLYIDGGTDPYLQEYFYTGMKHFYDILGHISKPGTIFVFGLPGSGKSSLRNVIAQKCRKDRILSIVYQDFGPLVSKQDEGIEFKHHVAQILKTALRTLAELADKGDLSLSQKLDNRSRIIRNQLRLYVSKYEDDPLRKQTLDNLLELAPPAKEDLSEAELTTKESLPTDIRKLLGRFCRYVAELFDYKFIYILVDPDVDIDPDEIVAWKVLEPLLSKNRLLEFPADDKVAFKFFLGQKFYEQTLLISWIEQERDKRVYSLEWPKKELGALLQERLRQCSKGRYKNLGQLLEPEASKPAIEDLNKYVIELSKSPRELVIICNRLFSEHCRRWSLDNREPLLITAQEVDEALRPFEERHRISALEQLIDQGESDRLEFKSTMRYNMKADRPGPDKEMEREVARTLCAFMNTEGGTLIIGVDDDGTVLGLDNDFSTLGRRKNKDGFEQAFVNITENLFDSRVSRNYKARFEKCQDKLVYVIEVERSVKPVFCLFGGVTEFYIREQTTTRKLDVKDTLDYCSDHFKD